MLKNNPAFFEDQEFLATGNLFSVLSEENFTLFAVRHYNNCNCSGPEEFYSDLEKLQTIKKMLTRYHSSGQINERLFLNLVIIFFNVFELDAAKTILLYKINRNHWTYIKTVMVFLRFMKEDELPTISEDEQSLRK